MNYEERTRRIIDFAHRALVAAIVAWSLCLAAALFGIWADSDHGRETAILFGGGALALTVLSFVAFGLVNPADEP